MKLGQLVEHAQNQMRINPRTAESTVCVRVDRPGTIGGSPVVDINHAGEGIDWDAGKYILYPEKPVKEDDNSVALIRRMMFNARRIAKLGRYTNADLYAELVGTGASTAYVRCADMGIDPDTKIIERA